MNKKNSIENVYIVGGGITGIASALYAATKNVKNIQIFEKNTKLGGILKDFTTKDGKKFFKDAQYINSKSPLLKLIDGSQFYSFYDHNGSYTSLNNKDLAIKNFPGPVFSTSEFKDYYRTDLQNQEDIVNCNQYLNQYPSKINITLKKYLKKFFDPSKIHKNCLRSLHLNRLSLDKDYQKTEDLKKLNPVYDNIYGLPKDYRNVKSEKYLLPKFKYDIFFKYIEKLLKDKKVSISYQSPISLGPNSLIEKNLSIKLKNQNISLNNSLLIWTSDPNPLLNLYKIKSKSHPIRMKNIYYERSEYIENPIYIQVFSLTIPITRIYLHENMVTVECLNSEATESLIIKSVKKIMKKFVPEQNFYPINGNIYNLKENRFILYTPEEAMKIKSLNIDFKENKVIFTPWLSYARDDKLKYIFEKIDDNL